MARWGMSADAELFMQLLQAQVGVSCCSWTTD